MLPEKGVILVTHNDHSRRTDSQANNKASNGHLRHRERRSLDDCADEEEKATDVDAEFSPVLIGRKTSDHGTDQCTARSNGRDQLLFVRIQFVSEVTFETDENGRNHTCIVT